MDMPYGGKRAYDFKLLQHLGYPWAQGKCGLDYAT
jgi:hypothetical protein